MKSGKSQYNTKPVPKNTKMMQKTEAADQESSRTIIQSIMFNNENNEVLTDEHLLGASSCHHVLVRSRLGTQLQNEGRTSPVNKVQ